MENAQRTLAIGTYPFDHWECTQVSVFGQFEASWSVDPPPHYRVGRKILVRRSEFDQWASKFRVVRPPVDLESVVSDVMRGLG